MGLIFLSPVVVDSPVGIKVRARARNAISGKQETDVEIVRGRPDVVHMPL